MIRPLLRWTAIAPVLAVLALAASWGRDLPYAGFAVIALLLGAAVLTAVHHADVIAHRVGEPFGSLILAVAVTVIEVGLIDADGVADRHPGGQHADRGPRPRHPAAGHRPSGAAGGVPVPRRESVSRWWLAGRP